MAFIKFHLTTNYVGTDADDVYEIPDEDALKEDGSLNNDYLDDIGYELARDNAEMYGIEPEDEDETGLEAEDPFSFSYEKLKGSREELEEEYGSILNL